MINFEFISPTKMFFGKGEEDKTGDIIASYGFKNVAIVYGNHIVKNGLLAKIEGQLKDRGINYYLCGGVSPNPKLSLVKKFLKDLEGKEVDLVLGIGGGSVIDSSKLLSHARCYDGEPYDFNMGKVKLDKCLPVGVILTLSAAGSELSNSCVITNDLVTPMVKRGFNHDTNRPLFAICNPELTYSVSKFQTGCGIVDSMMHTLERFLNANDESLIANNIAIGVLKTILHYGKIAIENPNDYEARANLMLASTLSHNGLTSLGKVQKMRVHGIEHVLSGFYDEIAHGEGLAILWPAYCRAILDDDRARRQLEVLAKELFNKDTAEEGIYALAMYFEEIGMKTTFDRELDFEGMANFYTNNKTTFVMDFKPIDYDLVMKVFNLARKDN